ncbi:MAG: class I SAM-dependent methyltransferase [Candidatus Methylomirabilales bacterium]
MKKGFRFEDNRDYWDRRWKEAGRDPDRFSDLNIYPIKYAELVIKGQGDRVLEIGAGLGRITKHYHYAGYSITGLETSKVAVDQLKCENPALDVRLGDVRDMPFANNEFDVVLAFGLYHNLEEEMGGAIAETARCLKIGGRFCISMRPDNFEMRLNEWLWWLKDGRHIKGNLKFHKWQVGEREFVQVLRRHGLVTHQVYRARNFSLLFRVPWFRGRSADETDRRGQGYRLNGIGRILDRILVRVFPRQFCNVLVFIGQKEI